MEFAFGACVAALFVSISGSIGLLRQRDAARKDNWALLREVRMLRGRLFAAEKDRDIYGVAMAQWQREEMEADLQ